SCRLERSGRPLAIALCGEEESAAAEDERAERRVTVRCALIDLREQALRLAKVAGRNQSLDSSRARQLGEVPVQLLDVAEELLDLPQARSGIVVGELQDRECNPKANGGESKPGCLEDLEQLGDLAARSFGLTSIGVDLGTHRQAKRLVHLQPDLARELYRLFAQLRGRVPGARRHLRLGMEEQ